MTQPSILWIVIDCGRSDRLSGHGHHRPTTPTLDRLAREGLDFRRAYSPAIWSLPAYTSLLTGLYPGQHGVNTAAHRLAEGTPTVAHALRRVGYATACFSNNAWLSSSFGVSVGFDRFDTMWFRAQESVGDKAGFLFDRALGELRGDADKGARRTSARVRDWIESHPDTPTFTFAAYVEPHTPYTSHRALRKEWAPGRPAGDGSAYAYDWIASLPERHVYDAERLEEASLRYDMEMRYLDDHLGDLLDGLKRDGLLEDTLVIVTADHGELLGEHGMMGHQFSVAEPLRHVPLVVWGPGIVPSAEIDELVQTVDLSAALCDLVGAEWDANPLGARLPLDGTGGDRQVAYTDYAEAYLEAVRSKIPSAHLETIAHGYLAASDDRYKLVRRTDGQLEAFDLAADPGELSPGVPDERFAELREAIDLYLSVAASSERGEGGEIPDDVREHLRALGYVE